MLLTRFFDNSWFRSIDDDFAAFERQFNDPGRRLEELWAQAQTISGPRFAFYDAGSEFVVHAELPGSGDNVHVTAKGRELTISGERRIQEPEGYIARRRERSPVKFTRTMTVPKEADVDRIEATHADGMLTLRMPKLPEAQPRQITIKQA